MCGFAGFVGKVEDRETVQGNMLMRMRLLDFGV